MATASFPLPTGTVLAQGTIVDLTLTAYKVESADGETCFVPFVTVHLPVPVTPLVVFA